MLCQQVAVMAGNPDRNLMKFMLGFLTICTWTLLLESSSLSSPDSGFIQLESFQKSVEGIALLPLWSQKVVLKEVGEIYVKHNATECNVFRGSETCLAAPDYSNYIKTCNSKNKPVDCAFKSFITKGSFEGLSLVPQQYVGAEGLMDCADCQDKFEKFWCAVNTPPCGTIDKVLDEILPLMSSITLEKSSATLSLQQALPRIIQAASLGFPCKKMCRAVMDSCGCAQQSTFGEVIDAIQVGGNLNATITMGLSTKELFHLIWDKHVCDLFSEESFPGFSGPCVSSYQTSRCNWCNGIQGSKSLHKKFVEQGVLQLSKMFFSLMQGGLQEILLAVDNKTQGKKPTNHIHCIQKRKIFKVPIFCQEDNADAAWYKKMEGCITPLPKVENIKDIAGMALEKWPKRVTAIPPRITMGTIPGITGELFNQDTKLWNKRLIYYKRFIERLTDGRYRNIMDMNAGLGGFAAALANYQVWVMNAVPADAQNNTLGIIYERGLIGTYMDWCEAFSTYPRTYDLIHANGIFSMYQDRCDMVDILLEMDRILRPGGAVIIRDSVDALVKVKKITDRMRWQSQLAHNERGPFSAEKILFLNNTRLTDIKAQS